MADISEVLDAVRNAAAAILYPNGVGTEQNPRSIVGSPLRIYVGWPDASLDQDLRKGICQVTIWPRGMAREVGPYLTGWVSVPPPAPSLTAVTADTTVTFGGTSAVPQQIAAVIIDRSKSYTVPVLPSDTPDSIAASLALAISVDRAATATGPVLDVPGAFALAGRVVAGGNEVRESRRMSEGIQITAWCPTPALRDAIITRLDLAFSDDLRSLPLPDGTIATLTYAGSLFNEEARSQPLHRRDLLLSAEFPTVLTRQAPGIAVPVTNLAPEPALIRRTILS
jgi:hypothetical protein